MGESGSGLEVNCVHADLVAHVGSSAEGYVEWDRPHPSQKIWTPAGMDKPPQVTLIADRRSHIWLGGFGRNCGML